MHSRKSLNLVNISTKSPLNIIRKLQILLKISITFLPEKKLAFSEVNAFQRNFCFNSHFFNEFE